MRYPVLYPQQTTCNHKQPPWSQPANVDCTSILGCARSNLHFGKTLRAFSETQPTYVKDREYFRLCPVEPSFWENAAGVFENTADIRKG